MNAEKVKFGTLMVGDIFTLNNPANGPEYCLRNIVIKPSIFIEDNGTKKPEPFNVVSLSDGRVRTFRPDEMVIKLDRIK